MFTVKGHGLLEKKKNGRFYNEAAWFIMRKAAGFKAKNAARFRVNKAAWFSVEKKDEQPQKQINIYGEVSNRFRVKYATGVTVK